MAHNVYRVEHAECVKQTGKALLIEAPEFEEPEWVPQSQIDDDSDVFDDQEHASGTLVVTFWFAQRRGWI